MHWHPATATLASRTITYTLRHSARARHPNLRIDPAAGLVVTVPQGGACADAERMLRRHQAWVLRWTARFERQWGALPKRWPYGPTLLYRGHPHAVRLAQAKPARVEVTDAREIVVSTPTPGIESAKRVLTRWLQQQAEHAFAERVRATSERMGLTAGRIYVRRLRRRWGSCWPGGNLSFHTCLVMAPPEVLDYVVVHELAHLRHRNHADGFWALVAAHHPGYQARRAWLRTNSPSLSL